MKLIKNLTVITLATTIISGCGGSGGGSGSSTTASPNGIYSGNITGGETLANGIEEKGIIYNNRFMLFSTQTVGNSQIFNADLTVTDLALSGTGERYSSDSMLNNISYNGTFVASQSASINFSRTDSGVNTLTDGTMNLTSSTSLYAKGSANSRLLGSWTGTFDTFGSQMDLNFDATGVITSGSDQAPLDCAFTGSISAADTSVNVYNVTINSSGTLCTITAGTYTGLAWTEGDTDGTLVLIVSDGSKARAVILTKN